MDAIQEALSNLNGLRLRCIGRAADLLWVQFGEWHEVSVAGGGIRSVGDWALHIQCPWRFTRGPKIVVGLRDIYYDAATGKSYDWNAGGESRFDRYAALLNADLEATTYNVSAITADRVGGFTIAFGPELCFDVFPDTASSSPDFEYWRLFQPHTKGKHFVVETDEPGDV